MIHHFLLTRFNLVLWQHDKNGDNIDRTKWLEERLNLFETYCLPSVVGQTCQDFEWILLVDANTPKGYRERIKAYKEQCQQIKFVAVKSQYGFKFPDVFSDVVNDALAKHGARDGDLCLTTYLDNDDCLNKRYVERVQKVQGVQGSRVQDFFMAFDYGLQYFTELHFATKVSYPNNHFITLVEHLHNNERLDFEMLKPVKTCYGYGSHFLLEKNHVASVLHVASKDEPMWIEVVHKDNVDNDVKMTLDTSIVDKSADFLRDEFSINVPLSNNKRLNYSLRVLKQMLRRSRDKFIHRKW